MTSRLIGQPTDRTLVRVTNYWSFIVIGSGGAVLGPALLPILDSFHLSPSAAGALFVAGTLGYTVAVLIGGPAGDHFGRQVILRAGAALYAIGLCCFVVAPSWPLAVMTSAVAAMGSGVIDSGTNALTNDVADPDGHAAEQSVLHAFFGLGALIGPLLIGGSLALHAGWRPTYLVIALFSAILFVLLGRLRLAGRATPSGGVSVRSVVALARNRLILLLGLIIGLFVGVELLAADWSAAYLQRIQHLNSVVAAAAVGLFWGGLLMGRLVSALVSRRYSSRFLLVVFSTLSFLASTGLALAPNALLALIALTAFGLGASAGFPLVMAVAGEAFPETAGSVAGLLTACGSIGSVLFPFAGGFLVQFADARAAFVLAVPTTALSAGICLLLYRGHRKTILPTVAPFPVVANLE